MDSREQRQIELVLRDAVTNYTKALDDRLQAVYSDHSAKGRLQSGATIRVAVRAMEELAIEALGQMSSGVLEIARSSESYSTLCISMNDLIDFFRDELATPISMANGRQPHKPNSSIEMAAYELFDEMASKLERKIEILEYKFSAETEPNTKPSHSPQSSKTGRPRAAFWDDMWASIARDLYEGDLRPQTQADVETAMLQWIENHGHAAAVSTVRGRARRLWDLICAE